VSVKYGLSNAHYAIMSGSGYATPAGLPGAESLTLDDHADFKIINAAGIDIPAGVKGAYKSGELGVVSLPLTFLTGVFGYRYENGVLIEGKTVSKHFAMLFETLDGLTPERFVYYDCIALLPQFKRETIGESVELETQKLKIAVCRPIARLLRGYNADYSASVLFGEQAYDTWFDGVYLT